MPSFAPSIGRREQFLNRVCRHLSTEESDGCLEFPPTVPSKSNGVVRTCCSTEVRWQPDGLRGPFLVVEVITQWSSMSMMQVWHCTPFFAHIRVHESTFESTFGQGRRWSAPWEPPIPRR